LIILPGSASLARSEGIKNHINVKRNFLRRFNLIWAVQSCYEKYLASPFGRNSFIDSPSRPTRGALRGRHGRWVRDAVDVAVSLTNGTQADGEVVWS
jgi:hypothetical protein